MFTIKYYKGVESNLYNYKAIKAEIKNIDLELQELENEGAGCKAIGYEEKSAPTNKFNSVVENETLRTDKLKDKRHKLKVQLEKIDNALETLSDDEMQLIELRYFKKFQFKVIAQIIDRNEMYCVYLKSEIIKKLIPLIYV